jgi:hypothetical protein
MGITAKLDDLGKPAWIALMILGFLAYWPIGLGILAYVVWSGRMRCWKRGGYGRWHNEGKDRMHEVMGRWCGGAKRGYSSGNSAFDDYREETIRRLEEESASSRISSSACARPRTNRSSTSSWPIAAAAHHKARNSRQLVFNLPRRRSAGPARVRRFRLCCAAPRCGAIITTPALHNYCAVAFQSNRATAALR